MKISNYQAQPTFGIRFYNGNKAFTEVLDYAYKHKKLQQLDEVMSNLINVRGGDILIIHGQSGKNMYSSFTMGRKSVRNEVRGFKSPVEATFNAIIDLIDRDNPKLMQLLQGRVKRDFNYKNMLKKYTV